MRWAEDKITHLQVQKKGEKEKHIHASLKHEIRMMKGMEKKMCKIYIHL